MRLLSGLILLVAACGGGAGAEDGCADVVGVEVAAIGSAHRFDVTVSSADTGEEKYADAWEVVAPDGTLLGTRTLLHPHVGEQPFTRSLEIQHIPPEVEQVTVRARDSVSGFCGEMIEVMLP